MSECVVRMEMPKCCEDCAAEYDCMACGITGTPWYESEEFNPSNGRLPDCPIICQLPEGHGGLVDADKLMGEMKNRKWMIGRASDPDCLVLDAPTIVPAERSDHEAD